MNDESIIYLCSSVLICGVFHFLISRIGRQTTIRENLRNRRITFPILTRIKQKAPSESRERRSSEVFGRWAGRAREKNYPQISQIYTDYFSEARWPSAGTQKTNRTLIDANQEND
jgi:hypothetical protein